ncbi:MAG: SAM-dependent methyltransferase, partial [Clostridia bacterium]|nr:SAM-dependent methyltransferase [Clostridia bacterium]MBO5207400.1 SAM-dependent methyltransferase [Clostridia bacterium]
MMNKDGFLSLICDAFDKEIIKKLVFSRPISGEVEKISARLSSHRGRKLLILEYFLPGNTVSHKNLSAEELCEVLSPLIDGYRQINLLTSMGNAEYKISKSGSPVVLGGDALQRKLSGGELFTVKLEPIDREKSYILSGTEPFLRELGISSSDGRVHDKKQGKFRQINKFLEHIEELYARLPKDGEICIYDLCCGKSYLSFAVYHFLTEIKGRSVYMLGIDLKRDVILWCESLAKKLGYSGMHFEVGDILALSSDRKPDMVISLHACDIATDIVLSTATRLGADIILSTPCCHKYLSKRVDAPELDFVLAYPHLKNKISEILTDALRISYLRSEGYSVTAPELTDPENTPKNTLIRAVKQRGASAALLDRLKAEYRRCLEFVLGEGADDYLKEIR